MKKFKLRRLRIRIFDVVVPPPIHGNIRANRSLGFAAEVAGFHLGERKFEESSKCRGTATVFPVCSAHQLS